VSAGCEDVVGVFDRAGCAGAAVVGTGTFVTEDGFGGGAAAVVLGGGAVVSVGAGPAADVVVVVVWVAVVAAGADGCPAGVCSDATWVGGAATGSPGTAGCWPPAPARLPLSAIATMPAVHSAVAIRFRLVRSVLPCD
jgi:hypothetical protein